MWHEARKHEKKLRVMIVDYRKRAERRREFYEKFKADPTQFMQVHGRPCKIHLDSNITAAADKCLMPWQGQKDTMIDRFDGRAHLDVLPDVPTHQKSEANTDIIEEPSLNYERYRILIQNDVAGISEDPFLKQIYIEEQFGTPAPQAFKINERKSSKLPSKAAIGYNYEDSTPNTTVTSTKFTHDNQADEDSEDDVDFDLIVSVNDLTIAQTSELNQNATLYGMTPGSFMTFLNADVQEREQIKNAKLHEEEKQTMSGRKARRERRAFKDRIILRKGYVSPPSYAAANSPFKELEEQDGHSSSHSDSESQSRIPSPEKITFITSFGENESSKDKKKGEVSLIGPSLPPSLPQVIHSKWSRNRSSSNTLKNRRSRSPSESSFRRRQRYKSRSRSPSSSRKHSYRRSRNSRSPKSSNSSYSYRDRESHRRHRHKNSSSSSSSSPSSRRKSRVDSRAKLNRNRRSRSRSRSIERHVRSRHRSDSTRRGRSHSPKTNRRSNSRSKTSKSPIRLSRRGRVSSSRSTSSSSATSHSRDRRATTMRKNNGSTNSENKEEPHSKIIPPPPLKRYYGRQNVKEDEESPLSLTSSDSEGDSAKKDKKQSTQKHDSRSGQYSTGQNSKSGVSSSSKAQAGSSMGMGLTPQERLKRRMQAALNKQLRTDKEVERFRQEKVEQERVEREDSLRELTIKYRRREREKRHKNRASDSSSETSDSDNDKKSSQSRSSGQSPSVDYS